jgi:hypothetical protein
MLGEIVKCIYNISWRGACGAELDPVLDAGQVICPEHREQRCGICGAQAVRECNQTMQFVCGFRLCLDHTSTPHWGHAAA